MWCESDLDALIAAYPQCTIIIDEAYIEFSQAVQRKALSEENTHVYWIRTFSKAFGLAGVRLGYVISHKPFPVCFKQVMEWAKSCGANVLDNLPFYLQVVQRVTSRREELERITKPLTATGGNFVCHRNAGSAILAAFTELGIEVRQKYGVTRVTVPAEGSMSDIQSVLRRFPQDDIRQYSSPIELRAELVSLLRKFIKVYKGQWRVTDGTLLGALRHRSIIPWDDDIDLVCLDLDKNRIEELRRHFRVERNRTDAYWQIASPASEGHPRDNPHIDLFELIECDGRLVNSDPRFQTEKFGDCAMSYTPSEIYNPVLLQFYDFTVLAPRVTLGADKMSTYLIRLPDRIIEMPAV